jgi:hypothetical protein
VQQEPIPRNVIFVEANNGEFYRGSDPKAGLYNMNTFMGSAFKAKWYSRRKEFPQDASPFPY